MTRADVLNRVRDELEAVFPGEWATFPATVDDLDSLNVALTAALDEIQEDLESAERGQAERNLSGAMRAWMGKKTP